MSSSGRDIYDRDRLAVRGDSFLWVVGSSPRMMARERHRRKVRGPATPGTHRAPTTAGWNRRTQSSRACEPMRRGRKTGAEPHLDATGRRHVIWTRTPGAISAPYSRQNVSRAATCSPSRRAPISRSQPRHFVLVEHIYDPKAGTRPRSNPRRPHRLAFPRSRFGRDKAIYLLAYGVMIEVVQHFLRIAPLLKILDVVAECGWRGGLTR